VHLVAEHSTWRRGGVDAEKAAGLTNMAKAPSEKKLDELAQDMHTRSEGLTHLMAKAEMELRRTRAQLRATICILVASIAAAVSAASAAIAAGVAAFHGARRRARGSCRQAWEAATGPQSRPKASRQY
jgi:hypothetical protein